MLYSYHLKQQEVLKRVCIGFLEILTLVMSVLWEMHLTFLRIVYNTFNTHIFCMLNILTRIFLPFSEYFVIYTFLKYIFIIYIQLRLSSIFNFVPHFLWILLQKEGKFVFSLKHVISVSLSEKYLLHSISLCKVPKWN